MKWSAQSWTAPCHLHLEYRTQRLVMSHLQSPAVGKQRVQRRIVRREPGWFVYVFLWVVWQTGWFLLALLYCPAGIWQSWLHYDTPQSALFKTQARLGDTEDNIKPLSVIPMLCCKKWLPSNHYHVCFWPRLGWKRGFILVTPTDLERIHIIIIIETEWWSIFFRRPAVKYETGHTYYS